MSKINSNTSGKVFVGLSGGVDSAVSAALLKALGYDVTGVYIKVWQPDWIDCNWKEERRDAMRVAAHLNIPFITLDLIKEYKEGVIDYMISEYSKGRTPNPDVMCNKEVKFGSFEKWARAKGADYIATGHYARNIDGKLYAGIDNNKDQSYFLWTVNTNVLKRVLFPIGYLKKTEVRDLAVKFGLPNADKKDSQGLCFIGKIDVKEFIIKMTNSSKGRLPLGIGTGLVLDQSGKVIGNHNGALTFTIGERHGFTIFKKIPKDLPYYVVSKDLKRNIIVVSQKKEKGLSNDISKTINEPLQKISISSTNWINTTPKNGSNFQVRCRYRQKLVEAKLISISDKNRGGFAEVELLNNMEYIAPGQSLVIYDGEQCLGGGIID